MLFVRCAYNILLLLYCLLLSGVVVLIALVVLRDVPLYCRAFGETNNQLMFVQLQVTLLLMSFSTFFCIILIVSRLP